MGYGLSSAAIVAGISAASRTNCETLEPWRLAASWISCIPSRVKLIVGAGHGHGEELVKRSSRARPLAPMLAVPIAQMHQRQAKERPPKTNGATVRSRK